MDTFARYCEENPQDKYANAIKSQLKTLVNNQKIVIASCELVEHPQLGKQASFKLFLESREKDKRYNARLYVVLNEAVRPQLCIEGVSLLECINDYGFVKDELYKRTASRPLSRMIRKVYKMLFPVSAVVTILDVPKHCIDIKKVNYNKKEPIGGGSYGNVYKGEYDGKTVAIKVLNASEMSDNDKSQLREIAVGASASNSKNLVTVYGYINDKSMTAIVMECGETDLEQYIKEGRFKTNKERVACLLQIASGIQQLHMQGIVDRDIKAKNVILVGNVWKLCDFGLSRYIGNDSLMLSSVGTPTFQSPENITKSICSTSMDVYSFGCLVAHIASWTEKGLIPCLPSSVDKVLQGLVRRCCLDKYLRPSIDKIISELENLYNIM
ncbi:hypothetical protein BLSTO_03360 [Blastocystis sp. subtype 1]